MPVWMGVWMAAWMGVWVSSFCSAWGEGGARIKYNETTQAVVAEVDIVAPNIEWMMEAIRELRADRAVLARAVGRRGVGCDVSAGRSVVCQCAAGYTGRSCETDINECSSSPCGNGGECVDGVDRFVCSCAAGYTGQVCETDINECSSSPCKNGGVCSNLIGGF
jgi:hypothetical protein